MLMRTSWRIHRRCYSSRRCLSIQLLSNNHERHKRIQWESRDRIRMPTTPRIYFANRCSFLSTQAVASDSDGEVPTPRHRRLHAKEWRDGPPTCFGTGVIANLAKSSVVGTCGQTVVLVTLATNKEYESDDRGGDSNDNVHSLVAAVKRQTRNGSDFVPLKVDVQHRYHAVGKIPTQSPLRRDNRVATPEDILASRAVDRALRPLMKPTDDSEIHVQCSIQACHLFTSTNDDESKYNNDNNDNNEATTTLKKTSRFGHPVALCLNSASVALQLQGYLEQPVACVCLALMSDGTIVMDPTRGQWEESGVVELLLAGTRNDVVMIEVSTRATNGSTPSDDDDDDKSVSQTDLEEVGISEEALTQLMTLGHAALRPLLEAQTKFCKEQSQSSNNQSLSDESEIRVTLGLPLLTDLTKLENPAAQTNVVDMDAASEQLVENATSFCFNRMDNVALVLFGMNLRTTKAPQGRSKGLHNVSVHTLPRDSLISKAVRGRREHVVYREVERLLRDEYVPAFLGQDLQDEYNNNKPVLVPLLARTIHDRLLRRALARSTSLYGQRGDGRKSSSGNSPAGWKAVRPISVTVPALPDVVHGSALFERGETQVLCTVTLGAPRDGIPLTHPYQQTADPRQVPSPTPSAFSDLPVGSLRYIRTQEALISDLNSRKVLAEREMTGDSGTLGEVCRAFLHYDFPAYSTGTTVGGGGAAAAANRRAIGHGALAERAVLPILPPAYQFPYAIRMNSEVTSSNGSSSMATVCGATLALIDAGVPIRQPVAGVSVGLAPLDSEILRHGLLLDITGTEDHYGYMDFKVAGTRDGVTALQLDVKKPLPLTILATALELAREGRVAILNKMEKLCEESSDGILQGLRPRPTLKDSAPRVEIVRFDPLRKRDLIGPGGAVLRQLEDRYGVSLDLTQEGQCLLFGANPEMVAEAKSAVMDLVSDVVVGGVYQGTVIELMDFGAVVELLRNKEGLLHVSEMGADLIAMSQDQDKSHLGTFGIVKQQLKVGQKIEVLCTDVDPVQGVIKLSRKALLLQKRDSAVR